MNKNKDDAVSAVIAMMLILAIITTCIAVYTSTYVPGLKQQSEIMHSDDVKFAFERFSADVNNIYSMNKNASFIETLSLGGGDVILSPAKSGGTLEVMNETVGTLVIKSGSETKKYEVTTANVTFTPVYTSWEKQGYKYSKGTVWIFKGNKSTPSDISLLSIYDGIKESKEFTDSINKSIIQSYNRDGGNASIYLPVMYADSNKNRATGSGTVKLKLTAETGENNITIPSGSTLLYRNSDGEQTIDSFGSETNLTINRLNIKVSIE